MKSKYVFVAELDNSLCGFGVYSLPTAELEKLYVLPKFQRSGIGKALLNHVKEMANCINVSCWENNRSSLEFYQACGFTEIGENYFNLEGELHRNIVLQCNT